MFASNPETHTAPVNVKNSQHQQAESWRDFTKGNFSKTMQHRKIAQPFKKKCAYENIPRSRIGETQEGD